MSNLVLPPELPDLFRAAGLEVAEAPGWKTRTSPTSRQYAPIGVIDHHTAGSSILYNYPEPPYWPWSSLYDKCQVTVEPSGRVVMIARGYAYSSGSGSSKVLKAVRNDQPLPDLDPLESDTNGNPHFINIEVQHLGNGDPIALAQYVALAKVNAVLCSFYGWDPMTRVIGHYEWAPDRKIDPYWDGMWLTTMPEIRTDTQLNMGVDMAFPLYYGNKKSEVGALQYLLNRWINHQNDYLDTDDPLVKIDDDFGPKTATALRLPFAAATQGVEDADLVVPAWWMDNLREKNENRAASVRSVNPHGNAAHPIPFATLTALDEVAASVVAVADQSEEDLNEHAGTPHGGPDHSAEIAALTVEVQAQSDEIFALQTEVQDQADFDQAVKDLGE